MGLLLSFSLYGFSLLSLPIVLNSMSKTKPKRTTFNFVLYVLFLLIGIFSSCLAILMGKEMIAFIVLLYTGCLFAVHNLMDELKD